MDVLIKQDYLCDRRKMSFFFLWGGEGKGAGVFFCRKAYGVCYTYVCCLGMKWRRGGRGGGNEGNGGSGVRCCGNLG